MNFDYFVPSVLRKTIATIIALLFMLIWLWSANLSANATDSLNAVDSIYRQIKDLDQ